MPRTAQALTRCFPFLTSVESARLARIDASPFPTADGAALLLGHDLWVEPLLEYRDLLEREFGAPPPLWRFDFGLSAGWDSRRWRSLSLSARIVRARAGSLAHRIERRLTAGALELATFEFSSGLATLRGAVAPPRGTPIVLKAIASPEELRVDLHLVELLVHWFRMLAHADRIARESLGTGFDVCGYAGACSLCYARWGAQPRAAEVVPPFHPGCRCFAQPRFVT